MTRTLTTFTLTKSRLILSMRPIDGEAKFGRTWPFSPHVEQTMVADGVWGGRALWHCCRRHPTIQRVAKGNPTNPTVGSNGLYEEGTTGRTVQCYRQAGRQATVQ